jgi:hypothetical protein
VVKDQLVRVGLVDAPMLAASANVTRALITPRTRPNDLSSPVLSLGG